MAKIRLDKCSGRTNCVAIDDSESSQHAFNWYINNYHKPEDKLVLIHIHETPHTSAFGLMSTTLDRCEIFRTTVESSIKRSENLLDRYQADCNKRNVTCKVVLKDDKKIPGQMICDIAKQHGADLLVIGQKRIGSEFIGQTCNYVLRHSPAPLLMVPYRWRLKNRTNSLSMSSEDCLKICTNDLFE